MRIPQRQMLSHTHDWHDFPQCQMVFAFHNVKCYPMCVTDMTLQNAQCCPFCAMPNVIPHSCLTWFSTMRNGIRIPQRQMLSHTLTDMISHNAKWYSHSATSNVIPCVWLTCHNAKWYPYSATSNVIPHSWPTFKLGKVMEDCSPAKRFRPSITFWPHTHKTTRKLKHTHSHTFGLSEKCRSVTSARVRGVRFDELWRLFGAVDVFALFRWEIWRNQCDMVWSGGPAVMFHGGGVCPEEIPLFCRCWGSSDGFFAGRSGHTQRAQASIKFILGILTAPKGTRARICVLIIFLLKVFIFNSLWCTDQPSHPSRSHKVKHMKTVLKRT